MKRITPEEVVEAYRVTGLKPIRGDFYLASLSCADGIGVLWHKILMTGHRPIGVDIYDWACGQYYSYYTNYFIEGFNGYKCSNLPNKRAKQGYEDGRAAWDAVVAAGLVEIV